MARQHKGIALSVRVPGDGGPGLGLLWHACIIIICRAYRHVQLQDGLSVSFWVRKGQKDQGLTNLALGCLWVSVLANVVLLCVLHVLAMTTPAILVIVSHYIDLVIRASVRYIHAATRTAGLGQREDRLGV